MSCSSLQDKDFNELLVRYLTSQELQEDIKENIMLNFCFL